MDSTKQPGLQISQIILLGAKFAHRDDAFALPTTTGIESVPIQVEIKVSGNAGDPATVVRVRAFTGDDPELLYRFDVEIAALITKVSGEENLDPVEYGRRMGAAALYPFVREAVASLTMRGRFGPLWLKPYNFAAMTEAIGATGAEA